MGVEDGLGRGMADRGPTGPLSGSTLCVGLWDPACPNPEAVRQFGAVLHLGQRLAHPGPWIPEAGGGLRTFGTNQDPQRDSAESRDPSWGGGCRT